MLPYAELHCLTNFSFLQGASHPEELVERAHELGYAALAITDECSLAGVVRAHLAARRCGLALLVGSQLRLADAFDGARLVLLAASRRGYGDLKKDLAQVVGDVLTPFRARALELLDDPTELDRILAQGADRIRPLAAATMQRVYDRVGVLAPGSTA